MQSGARTNALGVDVSEWQGLINWAAVVKYKQFARIRTSYGIMITDAMFKTNWLNARKANVLRSAYHFAVPNESDPQAQAALMLSIANKSGGISGIDLPPALDLEDDGGLGDQALGEWAVAFCNDIDAAVKNLSQRTQIYSYPSFITDHPITFNMLSSRKLWIASYNPGGAPPDVGPWNVWTVWQYADNGHVPGINAEVDLDEWAGSLLPTGLPTITVSPSPTVAELQAQLGQSKEEVTRLQNILDAINKETQGE